MPFNNKNKLEESLAGLEVDSVTRQSKQEKNLQPEKPEIVIEKSPFDNKQTEGKKTSENNIVGIGQVSSSQQTAVPIVKSQLQLAVEDVLEDGLADIYQTLSDDKKLEFRKTGEATAAKITLLLKSTKVQFKKIFLLIIKWLKVIPGVNKFFLEQEAKIKADRLINLKKGK